jgi:hypothetical protein
VPHQAQKWVACGALASGVAVTDTALLVAVFILIKRGAPNATG